MAMVIVMAMAMVMVMVMVMAMVMLMAMLIGNSDGPPYSVRNFSCSRAAISVHL